MYLLTYCLAQHIMLHASESYTILGRVMSKRTLPSRCPCCQQALKVTRLACGECETAVEGQFDLPILARLNEDDQEFVLSFLQSSGSLKDLSRRYGISYPTVRNRLDALIESVNRLESTAAERQGDGGE